MGAHLNRLAGAILMSTLNIGFYDDLTKIIFELSSNTHLISSPDGVSVPVTNVSECDAKWDKWFLCPEGRCLPASGLDNVVCDHYSDCLNGEDEEGCGELL